ncbi:toll-like receptor 3 [Saccostrea cucullata]|uniref:toll-like receptor 3 n=1 Tax=Saccostrea cuccullata TaxID=36930 RepID=UPI002ED072EF
MAFYGDTTRIIACVSVLLIWTFPSSQGCMKGCVCDNATVSCTQILTFSAFTFQPKITKLNITLSYLGPHLQTPFSHYMDLEELYLSNNRLHVLGANIFKFLRRLTYLDLSMNHLVRLDNHIFQHLSSLEVLDLSRNDFFILPDIPFRYLRNLRVFNMSFNQLQNPKLGLRFQVMTSLNVLDLSGNNFTVIGKDTFENTQGWSDQVPKHVNLSYCAISVIEPDTFVYPVRMELLSLAGNPGIGVVNLTDMFNSSHFEQLKHLDISDMNLTDVTDLIPMFSRTSLSELKIARNNLREIPLSLRDYLRRLTVLDISYNQLDKLSNAVTEIGGLLYLDASHNKIKEIDETFKQSLTNLHTLRLSQNRLGDNSVSVTNCEALKLLDLSFNEMTHYQAPSTLRNLEDLLLSGNRISNISSMTGLHNLQRFDISQNSLIQLPEFLFLDSRKLIHTNFSSNKIAMVNHQTFRPKSPDVIDLSNNKIVRLRNAGWKTAKSIDLHGNKISEMDDQSFYAMYDLKELDLSQNNLSQLNPAVFVFLSDLLVLQLQHNYISNDIELYNTMQSLYQIKSVDLSHNKLRYLTEGTFNSCPNLEKISMSDNPIHLLHSSTFSVLKKLQEVDFSNSNFLCGCELIGFQEWMLMTKVRIIHQSNSSYVCKSPIHRLGMDVRSYEMSDFECDETLFYVTVFSSIAAGIMVIGAIAALIYYYCCKNRTQNSDEMYKPIMNGSVPLKEEKKRRGIPIEILKNADASEVEKLLKAEYRRKKAPEVSPKMKVKEDSKKKRHKRNTVENRITRDMIRYPGIQRDVRTLPRRIENRYMDRRDYYRPTPSRPIYNPYLCNRSKSQVDLYPPSRRPQYYGYRERPRNPYFTAQNIDIIRRPQPRYSQSMPDMLNRITTLPKPRPPREPHYIRRDPRTEGSAYDVRAFNDPAYRPWADQERWQESRREYIAPDIPPEPPTIHSGYYTISAKTAERGSGNRTQWI